MLHPYFVLLHSLEIVLREKGKIAEDRKIREKAIQGFVSKLMSVLEIVDILDSCNGQFFI